MLIVLHMWLQLCNLEGTVLRARAICVMFLSPSLIPKLNYLLNGSSTSIYGYIQSHNECIFFQTCTIYETYTDWKTVSPYIDGYQLNGFYVSTVMRNQKRYSVVLIWRYPRSSMRL